MTSDRANHTSRPTSSLYLINAKVDWLCVGLGSLLTLGLVWALGDHLNQAMVRHVLMYALIFLGNAPHFAATNYRLYRSRGNIRQYPVTALFVPVLVFAAVAASLAFPVWIAPAFVKLYILWSPFHYSGQSVGISLLYAKRGEFSFGRIERFLLSTFIYGTFITSTAYAETGEMKVDYFGIVLPALGFPPVIARVAECGMYACGLALVILLLARSAKQRKLFPLITLLPAAAQFVWLLVGPRYLVFFQLVPFFHGAQYLIVAWFMQMRERQAERHDPISISFETAWWAIANIIGGIALFYALPIAVASALGRSPFLAMPLALAGMQIHHFFVDGVIWKLRHPHLRAALIGRLRDAVPRVKERRLAA